MFVSRNPTNAMQIKRTVSRACPTIVDAVILRKRSFSMRPIRFSLSKVKALAIDPTKKADVEASNMRNDTPNTVLYAAILLAPLGAGNETANKPMKMKMLFKRRDDQTKFFMRLNPKISVITSPMI